MEKIQSKHGPLEYVNCVFYLATDPPSLGRLGAELLTAIAAAAKLPDLSGGATRDFASPDPEHGAPPPGWGVTKEGNWGIDFPRSAPGDPVRIRRLRELPADAASIILERPAPGAKIKWLDYLWKAVIESADRPPFTVNSLIPYAYLAVSLRTSVLKAIGAAPRARLLDAICRVAADAGCSYGLIECEAGEATNGLFLYGNVYIPEVAPHTAAAEAAWRDPSTDRSQHVRGVYWGNFLGPTLAARLGEEAIRGFDGWSFDRGRGVPERARQGLTRYPNGSALLTLTDEVLDATQHDEIAIPILNEPFAWPVRLATWLRVRLRERGMLV